MLGNRAGANKQVLRNAFNHGYQGVRHDQPAQPPACHIEVLAERVDADHVLTQLIRHGQSCVAKMRLVAQPKVNLVNHRDTAAAGNVLSNALQFFRRD